MDEHIPTQCEISAEAAAARDVCLAFRDCSAAAARAALDHAAGATRSASDAAQISSMAWYATLSSDEAAQISRLGALAAARAAEAVTAWNRAAASAADAADAVAAVDFTKCCRCAVEARAAEKDGARAAARAKTYPIMRVRGGVGMAAEKASPPSNLREETTAALAWIQSAALRALMLATEPEGEEKEPEAGEVASFEKLDDDTVLSILRFLDAHDALAAAHQLGICRCISRTLARLAAAAEPEGARAAALRMCVFNCAFARFTHCFAGLDENGSALEIPVHRASRAVAIESGQDLMSAMQQAGLLTPAFAGALTPGAFHALTWWAKACLNQTPGRSWGPHLLCALEERRGWLSRLLGWDVLLSQGGLTVHDVKAATVRVVEADPWIQPAPHTVINGTAVNDAFRRQILDFVGALDQEQPTDANEEAAMRSFYFGTRLERHSELEDVFEA